MFSLPVSAPCTEVVQGHCLKTCGSVEDEARSDAQTRATRFLARCGRRRGERSERGSSSHLGFSSSALASSCIIHISFLAVLVQRRRWRAKKKKNPASWLEFRGEIEGQEIRRREWELDTFTHDRWSEKCLRTRTVAWRQKKTLLKRTKVWGLF